MCSVLGVKGSRSEQRTCESDQISGLAVAYGPTPTLPPPGQCTGILSRRPTPHKHFSRQSMAPSSRVKSACEYCHRRKIRCIISPGGSACHNCVATETACLFAPKARAGRPPARRPNTTNQAIQSVERQTSETSFALGEQTDNSTPALIGHPAANDDQHAPDMDVNASPGLEPHFLFPTRPYNYPDELYTRTTSDLQDSPHEPGLPTSESDSLGWSNILSTCADLDNRCRSLSGPLHLPHAESHIRALEDVCMQYIKVHLCSDSAIHTLSQAALHKALDLCRSLVKHFENMEEDNSTSRLLQFLMLKRLDTIVIFGKLCFTKLEEATGTRTAENIHASIERLLEKNQDSTSG
jgi:hypothetical protein